MSLRSTDKITDACYTETTRDKLNKILPRTKWINAVIDFANGSTKTKNDTYNCFDQSSWNGVIYTDSARIPQNAEMTRCFARVVTACTSSNQAETISVGTGSGGSAATLVPATACSALTDNAKFCGYAGVPVLGAGYDAAATLGPIMATSWIQTTTAGVAITYTLANTADILTGKIELAIEYIEYE